VLFVCQQAFLKKIEKQYPEEPLFAGDLLKNKEMIGYRNDFEKEAIKICIKSLSQWISSSKIFCCEQVS